MSQAPACFVSTIAAITRTKSVYKVADVLFGHLAQMLSFDLDQHLSTQQYPLIQSTNSIEYCYRGKLGIYVLPDGTVAHSFLDNPTKIVQRVIPKDPVQLSFEFHPKAGAGKIRIELGKKTEVPVELRGKPARPQIRFESFNTARAGCEVVSRRTTFQIIYHSVQNFHGQIQLVLEIAVERCTTHSGRVRDIRHLGLE